MSKTTFGLDASIGNAKLACNKSVVLLIFSRYNIMNFLEASATPLACFFGSAIVVVSIVQKLGMLGKIQPKALIISVLMLSGQAYLVKQSLEADAAWLSLCLAGCFLAKTAIDLLLQIRYTARRANRRRKALTQLLTTGNSAYPVISGTLSNAHQRTEIAPDQHQSLKIK